ncbi:hypothetical protein LZD49_15510 [Dyadobacter sp. CY261]|uniref:hypothetical protein n=1 Tax=Dyadobacter sp. CY261 TaxID=2907203 RepID=UPI001F45E6D8|nr:hypothetical protein [Dyadobacter sp. CY261]MCF0071884.1 hypothetical protein [Dyadobacter sp. CY261]
MKLLRNTTAAIKWILLANLLGACHTENDNALTPRAPANDVGPECESSVDFIAH